MFAELRFLVGKWRWTGILGQSGEMGAGVQELKAFKRVLKDRGGGPVSGY